MQPLSRPVETVRPKTQTVLVAEAPTEHGALWKRTRGRPRRYPTPESLWQACLDYFKWAEDHPIYDYRPIRTKTGVEVVGVPKPRPFTLAGLKLHANLEDSRWHEYSEREEYRNICARAYAVMYEQKFTGAATEIFNPAIIARDLGLVDRGELIDRRANAKLTHEDKLDLARAVAFAMTLGQREAEQVADAREREERTIDGTLEQDSLPSST